MRNSAIWPVGLLLAVLTGGCDKGPEPVPSPENPIPVAEIAPPVAVPDPENAPPLLQGAVPDLENPIPAAEIAPPVAVPDPEKDIANSVDMRLRLIPAGEFMMGSPEDEKQRDPDEGPVHRVCITKPFYLGVYEVTQEQYKEVMGNNPSRFKGKKRPVDGVSWNDAVKFCKKLSAKEDRTYRLPTEAEWEYACRAGTTTSFAFGQTLSSRTDANCQLDGTSGGSEKDPDLNITASVGSYRPNPWGLYDMHGNLYELCQDRYEKDYYESSPTDNPTGPTSGSNRVLRGGSWRDFPAYCRSANRYKGSPNVGDFYLGFRVVLVPAGEDEATEALSAMHDAETPEP